MADRDDEHYEIPFTDDELQAVTLAFLWDRMPVEARRGVLREVPLMDHGAIEQAVQAGRKLRRQVWRGERG